LSNEGNRLGAFETGKVNVCGGTTQGQGPVGRFDPARAALVLDVD
jgi:hypothetical protein